MTEGSDINPKHSSDRRPWAAPKDAPGQMTPIDPSTGQHPSWSVRRLLTPFVVVAVLAAGVVGGLALWNANLNDRVDSASASVEAEYARQLDLTTLWSGLLGVVASGVGQTVTTPAQVSTLAGKARSGLPKSSSVGFESTTLSRRAADRHRRFVDGVESSVEQSDGDPISLGNDLSEIQPAYESAVVAGSQYLRELKADQTQLRAAAGRIDNLIVATLIAGALALVLTWLFARRRLRVILDEPAVAASTAVARFAGGDTGARAGSTTGSGFGPTSTMIDESLGDLAARIEELRSSSEWGERSRMIFEALDQTEDEPAAYQVVERALSMVDDDHHPVELLMSDRGSTKLRSVASDKTVPPPGCKVDTTSGCIALRRGQVSVFSSSESINACPMLRDRPGGTCSSVCVPVTVSGRPVGVFNMVGPEFQTPDSRVTDRLVTLSVQLGNRLSSLRTLESTRKEASTDGLTGLPNRRMLESEVSALLDSETPFVMVLADLDKFKNLNDSFGHEVGDKALQLFAGVSRDNVRGNDVVARVGGEEFVFVYPNMSVETSIEAIGRLRQALARAVLSSRLPPFTCSFGVTSSTVGVDGEAILRVADAGLLKAKELGGDQAVFADADMVEAMFGDSAQAPKDLNGAAQTGRPAEASADDTETIVEGTLASDSPVAPTPEVESEG